MTAYFHKEFYRDLDNFESKESISRNISSLSFLTLSLYFSPTKRGKIQIHTFQYKSTQSPIRLQSSMPTFINTIPIMTEQFQNEQSPHQLISSLPVYQSSTYMSRSVNLNELIKIHRTRQKYQVVDKFFNNSYISIENKLQPIETYYHYDMLKCYLEDLSLVYFKDIEFSETVRLEYVLRRINFTLYGEEYNFKVFLEDNRFYDEAVNLFSDSYLKQLLNPSNQKNVLELRNSLLLCYLIDASQTYGFSLEQQKDTLNRIKQLYSSIQNRINSQPQGRNDNNPLNDIPQHFLRNMQSESFQNDERIHQNANKQDENNDHYHIYSYDYSFDDLLYQEEIQLKIIESELQLNYFQNHINDPSIDEANKPNFQYIAQINKEIIEKLTELKDINITNRQIIKKIQKNIRLELITGTKCICIKNSNDLQQCFQKPLQIKTLSAQNLYNMQKVDDIQYMQNQMLKIVRKLKMKQIADAIQKVCEIQKGEGINAKPNQMLFSVTFQHGISIKQAVFQERDFVRLNQIREESMLTAYLTPMKSSYSYISHNIYTFERLYFKEFPYNKQLNNNEQIMKNIKNRVIKYKSIGKNQVKSIYHNFKLCHNCKMLCRQDFVKQCRKRMKQFRQQSDDQQQQDSLYTQKNYRRRHMPSCFIQCEKYYCLYCIKNQFNGKIFNEKGWCPACLDSCHCNTCLRDKILKKYIDFYIHIGGQISNVKTQKQIIDDMRIKSIDDKISQMYNNDSSFDGTEVDDKAYQSIIKKEIMKGYSPDQIGNTLKQQQQLMDLIIKKQQLKLRHVQIQQTLFREKIAKLNDAFNFSEIDRQNQNYKKKLQQKEVSLKLQQSAIKKKRKQRKILQKQSEKRKPKKIKRSQQIYYDFYRYDDEYSELQSSSFHLKPKKLKQRKYEPEYTF